MEGMGFEVWGEVTESLVYGESKLGGDEIVEYAKVRVLRIHFLFEIGDADWGCYQSLLGPIGLSMFGRTSGRATSVVSLDRFFSSPDNTIEHRSNRLQPPPPFKCITY